MKKTYMTMAIIALISLTGCSNNDVVQMQQVKSTTENESQSSIDINVENAIKDKLNELGIDFKLSKVDDFPDEFSKKVDDASSKMNEVDKKMDSSKDSINKIGTKIKNLGQTIDDASKSIGEVRDSAGEKMSETKNELLILSISKQR